MSFNQASVKKKKLEFKYSLRLAIRCPIWINTIIKEMITGRELNLIDKDIT